MLAQESGVGLACGGRVLNENMGEFIARYRLAGSIRARTSPRLKMYGTNNDSGLAKRHGLL